MLLKAHLHPGLIHPIHSGMPPLAPGLPRLTVIRKSSPSELCQSLSCHTPVTCVFAAPHRCYTHTHTHALVIYTRSLQSVCMLCDHRNLVPDTRVQFLCVMLQRRAQLRSAEESRRPRSRGREITNKFCPSGGEARCCHLPADSELHVGDHQPPQRPGGHGCVEARRKCE